MVAIAFFETSGSLSQRITLINKYEEEAENGEEGEEIESEESDENLDVEAVLDKEEYMSIIEELGD